MDTPDKQEVKNPELNAEVAKKFKVAGIQYAGQVRYKGKMIDLAKIDLKQAEALAKDEKFTYLVENKEAAPAPAAVDLTKK
jgi:hypothetical protein